MAALKLGHTGAAMAIDVGEARDIHPKNKQEVGRRLALQALADAYQKPIAAHGPTYTSVKFTGETARVAFAHAKGLTARGGAPTSLEIAGDDRKFVPATATIEGDTLIVRSAGHFHTSRLLPMYLINGLLSMVLVGLSLALPAK